MGNGVVIGHAAGLTRWHLRVIVLRRVNLIVINAVRIATGGLWCVQAGLTKGLAMQCDVQCDGAAYLDEVLALRLGHKRL